MEYAAFWSRSGLDHLFSLTTCIIILLPVLSPLCIHFYICFFSFVFTLLFDSWTLLCFLAQYFHFSISIKKGRQWWLFWYLELSSQLQQLIEKDFKGRSSSETFARSKIDLVGKSSEERKIEWIQNCEFGTRLPDEAVCVLIFLFDICSGDHCAFSIFCYTNTLIFES